MNCEAISLHVAVYPKRNMGKPALFFVARCSLKIKMLEKLLNQPHENYENCKITELDNCWRSGLDDGGNIPLVSRPDGNG